LFVFTVTSTHVHHPLSLHDALPICGRPRRSRDRRVARRKREPLHRAPAARMRISVVALLLALLAGGCASLPPWPWWYGPELVKADRKSTRLNSSHVSISYAVFCLKK